LEDFLRAKLDVVVDFAKNIYRDNFIKQMLKV